MGTITPCTLQQAFITEILFIDWPQNVLIPKAVHLSEKTKYHRKVVLIVDGHANHVTPRVIAFAGSSKLSLIRLVRHSSNIAQPLDLCHLICLKYSIPMRDNRKT
jgi:hypothetical protein